VGHPTGLPWWAGTPAKIKARLPRAEEANTMQRSSVRLALALALLFAAFTAQAAQKNITDSNLLIVLLIY